MSNQFEGETLDIETVSTADLKIGDRVVFALGDGPKFHVIDVDTVTSISDGVAWFDNTGIEMIDGREALVAK